MTPPGWFPDANQPGRLRWWSGTEWTDHYHDQSGASFGQTGQWGPGQPAPTQAAGPRPGPPLKISVAILVAGIVIAAVGGISIAVPFVRTITTSNKMALPGHARFHLSSGRYLVYERVATTSGGGGFTFADGNPVSIDAAAVRVTGASGTAVAVSQDTGITETITRDGETYEGAVAFTISATGDYDVDIPDVRPGRALVARSLGDAFRRALPWILVAVVGGLIAVAGLVMVIVGSVRRNRWSAGR